MGSHFSNFNSIVVAVSEGRRLFTNIQRFLLHLLAVNVAEVLLLIVGLCFQDEHDMSVFPLSPIGVLWVNMVSTSNVQKYCDPSLITPQLTSSPPAFGLGLEKAPPNLMRKPPHSLKDGVFSWLVIIDCMSYGIVMGGTCLLSVSAFAPLIDMFWMSTKLINPVRYSGLRKREWRPRARLQSRFQ